jgi:hypothetical protein
MVKYKTYSQLLFNKEAIAVSGQDNEIDSEMARTQANT